jgi:phosphoribosylaminoimidazolecarboxamide formyltransferase/IMP cyclohydrolase
LLYSGRRAALNSRAAREIHREAQEETVRALLSVANREGIADLARELAELGVDIYATDGTRAALAEAGVEIHPISSLTGSESLAGGQVKTFHANVYAGILAHRQVPSELEELAASGIELIDIVVVNVKPFAPEVARPVALDEVIELIDVGGTALLTAAARNYAAVGAVSQPAHYQRLVTELRERGSISAEFRQRLAADALADVAAYYAEIAAYLNHIANMRFPHRLAVVVEKVRDLGYGANPQQGAALYRETTHRSSSLTDAAQLQGETPTFNDLLDLDAAWRVVTDFAAPTCCIVKQANPTGLASNDRLAEAYQKALEGDPVSAFGAVVAVNREVDIETATSIAGGSTSPAATAGC